jgi:hypothetical protein
MGSPYLLAHGLGKPVEDASGHIKLTSTGNYRVFVRTKDWVARWGAPGQPGRFQVLINGKPLTTTFGTEGADWHWQDGGKVAIDQLDCEIAIHDLTGFDGRCDAIYLTQGDEPPPNEPTVLPNWRRQVRGIANEITVKEGYDLVVVGGGYSGMGAAISAARMGCKVALAQDRPVLGGNGSSEVRVWAMGNIRRGRFPRIGEIVEEFADHATKSPGTYEEFGDNLKAQVVLDEPNIDLMLNHHVHSVTMDGDMIRSVSAYDTRTGEAVEIRGRLFADCTGHGWIGAWSGADLDMSPEGRMGMSNMWAWDELTESASFPQTPWALDLAMADFPYPRDHHGQWFWESGFDKDAINDAEGIRDWNLRAVFGAFNAMKNRDGAADHEKAILTWVAYIGGPRESRRLMGDVVLNQEDIVTKRNFIDGCVPSTWSIDLHYPKEQYATKYSDNPFISVAVHGEGVDRTYGYPIPYRCFYSRNIPNLFMAGRCASVTHEALGTVRVMKTCGMMGEVVGKAASLCVLNDCFPREIYSDHLEDLVDLLHLPGKAHRLTVSSEIVIPDDALMLAGPNGPPSGLDPSKLDGVIADDTDARLEGDWTGGSGLKNYVGYGYHYASPNSKSTATFVLKPTQPGRYAVQLFHQPHENRSSRTLVTIRRGDFQREYRVNQQIQQKNGIIALDEIQISDLQEVQVTFSTDGADGFVHIDAVRLLPQP